MTDYKLPEILFCNELISRKVRYPGSWGGDINKFIQCITGLNNV